MARAKQDLLDRGEEAPVLPILIHGDAAFAGQGVVAETLNLSQLRGYRTGGTIHIVVNNQVGFTTGPDYGRSSTYATDVAKMVQAPIFHVNGDDPEACVRVARLAFEFRQAFQKDVVIDMWCYRRYGHNEGDEPAFTQPLMYERIENRRPVRKLYTETLVNRGDLSIEEAEAVARGVPASAPAGLRRRPTTRRTARSPRSSCERPAPMAADPAVDTTVDRDDRSTSCWSSAHRRARRLQRPPQAREVAGAAAPRRWSAGRVDWALGEALAFGSLLAGGRARSGCPGRTPGGARSASATRSWSTRPTAELYTPLAQPRAEGQGSSSSTTACCSEFAVLGFEYGYSVANPEALVLWEAQFGDFVNGAQIVVDQFIVGRRGQVGPAQRPGPAAPPRVRGPGPRALQRPPRAVPGAWPPRTTCRSPTPRPRPSTSTCCAARRCGPTASRWW